MKCFVTGLKQGSQAALPAALIWIVSLAQATAQENPNCTTTYTLSDAIQAHFNCGDRNSRVCVMARALTACCDDNSPSFGDQETCVCSTYSDTQRLRNAGFNTPAFCSP